MLEEYTTNVKRSIEVYRKQLIDAAETSTLSVNLSRERKTIEHAIGENLYYNNINSQE